MPNKKIDYDTILACKAGDSDALNQVLTHYDKMITDAASKTVSDGYGHSIAIVDQEIKQNIQQKLMLQIVFKYDHLASPPEKNGKGQQ